MFLTKRLKIFSALLVLLLFSEPVKTSDDRAWGLVDPVEYLDEVVRTVEDGVTDVNEVVRTAEDGVTDVNEVVRTAEDGVTDVENAPWRTMKEKTWCQNDRNTANRNGLQFIKLHKTASSTTSGVALRIATNVGRRMNYKGRRCDVQFSHVPARERPYNVRDMDGSYLWSVIRNPTDRAASFYFYRVISQKQQEQSDEGFMNFLDHGYLGKGGIETYGEGGYQLQYLATEQEFTDPSSLQDKDYVKTVVDKVVSTYDFIGITERLDESLVAMQLLLDLPVGDILHLDAKTSGGYILPNCKKIVKGVASEGMRNYLDSPEWKDRNIADFLLYEAVNKKLDTTIEYLGRSRFENALAEYKSLQELIHTQCSEKAVFPCKDGVRQDEGAIADCYWADSGCGYPCIDQVLEGIDATF